MRTVTFQSVMWGIAIRMGLDPRATFNANVAAAICEYVNSRTRFAWEKADWPEIVIIESRTPAAGLIAWAQSGQTVISDVFKVFRADPRTTPPPCDVYFTTDQEGIHIGPLEVVGSAVWVKYRTLPPVFTSIQYKSGTTYSIGQLVYDPVSGNCYASVTNGNTGNALTNGTYWTPVPMPYFLSEYVKTAAESDALREDGQTAKAGAEEQRAGGILMDAAAAQAAAEFDMLTQNIKQAGRAAGLNSMQGEVAA